LDFLSNTFKALGDPVRLRLFVLLGQQEEVCVCHLVDALALPQSTISRHLGVLRHAKLVSTRRDGKWMYYRLDGQIALDLQVLLQSNQTVQFQQDTKALSTAVCA